MKKNYCYLFIIGLCFFFYSCAVTAPELEAPEQTDSNQTPITYPEYTGERIPIAVLPMGLSERTAKQYPFLLEKSVGLGVHNVLTDALYRTKRFRFVEDKESVIKEAFKRQELSDWGVVDQEYAIKIGKMLGAKKVVYGEVYDYSEGKTEKIIGLKTSALPRVRVGLQIRLVDAETLEYIPASSVKYGIDWAEASQAAIESAVLKIVTNLN